ncbi:MAG: hypothetical protein EBX41_00340, partial [Chitinophagia bacterium]|nr:hypothetical protein [Chitinophagia bacterium]
MKKQRQLYLFLFFITAVAVAWYHATAHPYIPYLPGYNPEPDTVGKKDTLSAKKDSTAVKAIAPPENDTTPLKFKIYDKTGEPVTDYNLPRSIDLNDPPNNKKNFDYDPDSNKYFYNNRMGREYLRNPTYLNLDEYRKYRAKMDDDAYWARRLDAMMMFNKQPELPQMYKEGLFDRIFGGTSISVKPQGNVDLTFGRTSQDIKNPTLVQRAQKYSIFDFD